MALINKPLDSINEQDLLDLISNQVREIKTIEYKLTLPGNSDRDKKEFLFDVSSFANASGGDLIYGVKEVDATAVELVGLEANQVDREILRLENIIRDGIDPRIPNVRIWPVMLKSGKIAVIIRVAKSWMLPHRVKYGGTSRFYSRNSAGKYELDVSELRPLFAITATAAERIRDFRSERLSKITAGETPVMLKEGARIVLHIVPIAALDPSSRFDLSSLRGETDRLIPMDVNGGWNRPRYNFDGLVASAQHGGLSHSYLQLFRNGSAEAVNTSLIREPDQEHFIEDRYEREVLAATTRILSVQKELGVESPLFVMLSFLGVKGYSMLFSGSSPDAGHPMDRDNLLVPEEMLETFEGEVQSTMTEVFKIVWNAAGYSVAPTRP